MLIVVTVLTLKEGTHQTYMGTIITFKSMALQQQPPHSAAVWIMDNSTQETDVGVSQ